DGWVLLQASARSAARTRSRSASGAGWLAARPAMAARSARRPSRNRVHSAHPARWASRACASGSASSPSSHASTWASTLGWVISALLLRLCAQGLLEPGAGAGEPRHHRPDRDARHLADLLVGEALDLPQHDHLAELRREPVEH